MQIARALKGKGVKYICRVFVMGMIMSKLPSVSGLCSCRVGRSLLQTGGGGYKVNKIRAMRGVFKRDNEVRAETGGALLRDSINNMRSSRFERVPIVNIRGGLGDRVCPLKVYIMNGSVISKPTSNSIETVANRIVKQVLAIQSIAVHKM